MRNEIARSSSAQVASNLSTGHECYAHLTIVRARVNVCGPGSRDPGGCNKEELRYSKSKI